MADSPRRSVFKLLLYPDDESHVLAFQYLTNECRCLYILHDSDVDDSGNLKKKHWHLYVEFDKARTLKCLARDLGISDIYVRACENVPKFLRYLIHIDSPKKFQYSINSVGCSDALLWERFNRIIINGSEISARDFLTCFFDFVDSFENKYISTRQWSEFISDNGFDDLYNKPGIRYRVNFAITEHNDYVRYIKSLPITEK